MSQESKNDKELSDASELVIRQDEICNEVLNKLDSLKDNLSKSPEFKSSLELRFVETLKSSIIKKVPISPLSSPDAFTSIEKQVAEYRQEQLRSIVMEQLNQAIKTIEDLKERLGSKNEDSFFKRKDGFDMAKDEKLSIATTITACQKLFEQTLELEIKTPRPDFEPSKQKLR